MQEDLKTVKLQAEVEELRELESLRKEFDSERRQLCEDREPDAKQFREFKNGLLAEKEQFEDYKNVFLAEKENMLSLINQLKQQLAEVSTYRGTEHSEDPGGATHCNKDVEAEKEIGSLSSSVVPEQN